MQAATASKAPQTAPAKTAPAKTDNKPNKPEFALQQDIGTMLYDGQYYLQPAF